MPEGGQAVRLLMDAERALREAASALQQPLAEVGSREERAVYRTASALSTAVDQINAALDLGVVDDPVSVYVMRKARSSLDQMSWEMPAFRDAVEACDGASIRDEFCMQAARKLAAAMERISRAVRDAAERGCGFEYAEALRDPGYQYTLSSALNDLSNCVHVMAEYLAKKVPAWAGRRGESCYYVEGADKNLLDLCERWDRKVSDMSEEDAYSEQDYEKLVALVGETEATFRVGSSPGHAARVHRDGNVTYYDEDTVVLNTFRYLMELNGYSCLPLAGGLECGPPGPGALRDEKLRSRLADALSWVTSADIRVEDEIRDYCEEECGGEEGEEEREDFWSCVHDCENETYMDEQDKWRAGTGKPHPAAMRDLDRFMSWHRERGRKRR
jgi:hypothetical protein